MKDIWYQEEKRLLNRYIYSCYTEIWPRRGGYASCSVIYLQKAIGIVLALN